MFNSPQKYNPESDESTCLISRNSTEVLDVILNLVSWNPSQKVARLLAVGIKEMQLALSLSASLNQNMWVAKLLKLEHCSVISCPGSTATV